MVEGPAKLHGQGHKTEKSEGLGPVQLPTKDCVPKYNCFLEGRFQDNFPP